MKADMAKWPRRIFIRIPQRTMALLVALPVFALLLMLRPWQKIRIGALTTERLGHLALNVDLFCRRHQLQDLKQDELVIFLAGRPANRQLLDMWKRKLCVVECDFLKNIFEQTLYLWARTPFYEPLEMWSNEYREFNLAEPTLDWTDEEIDRGRSYLRTKGVDLHKDWFVCIYARDPEYLTHEVDSMLNWSYHDHRNADIDSYKDAIRLIVERGGFVFRMGYRVAKPLDFNHPRVIDYATTERTDFLDIFLISQCCFILGTTSGICDVAMIFDRPRIGINWVPFGSAPWGKNCLVVPKLLRYIATGELVDFAQAIAFNERRDSPWIWDGNYPRQFNIEYVDNTAEEITNATREMLDRLGGEFELTPADIDRQLAYRLHFSKQHWCRQVLTPVTRDFLKRYENLLGMPVDNHHPDVNRVPLHAG